MVHTSAGRVGIWREPGVSRVEAYREPESDLNWWSYRVLQALFSTHGGMHGGPGMADVFSWARTVSVKLVHWAKERIIRIESAVRFQ